MHEMAIVTEIADVVIRAAADSGASQIRAVYLTIGQGRDVVPELFEGMWAYYTKGTMADNSALNMTCVPFTVRCLDCGAIYPVDPVVEGKREWECFSCGCPRYTLNSGLEFEIDRVEVA